MIEWFTMATWSPYIVGAGIGVLIWFTFLLSDRPLGCSTAYAKTAGMVETGISHEKAESMPYYQKFTPTVDWQWILVIGIIIGAFISAYLSGTFSVLVVPPLFAETFGGDAVFRGVIALFGGILMGIGARWAGGCTSGHGISGALQLSLASWVAACCFFIGGILVAGMIYGFSFI
ncbi:MAG: YeeE/YedE thiosulfate transporter family protein [Methanocalculus sp.]|uniref:YeeE/YedE thiosulfate transporter family protein n=1 Tax=Methanocalculus sp. TaxID=2004547 RepID=UPI00271BD321|nr:YeeE/YedE thiosulfate transporter family protein [Methanocalculus sp.]MDO9539346.1 YeeE/YedE thiosulfate transporter family protein [Methanocalculus sp.]